MKRFVSALRMGFLPTLKLAGLVAMAWWIYQMYQADNWTMIALAVTLMVIVMFAIGSRKQVVNVTK